MRRLNRWLDWPLRRYLEREELGPENVAQGRLVVGALLLLAATAGFFSVFMLVTGAPPEIPEPPRDLRRLG